MTDLNRFLKNVLIFLIIVFIVYFIPKINEDILHHFDNIAVRAVCIGVILYTGMDDPIIALLLSVCFVMMHTKLQEKRNINLKINNDTIGKNYNIGSDIDIESVLSELEPDQNIESVLSEMEHNTESEHNNSGIIGSNSEDISDIDDLSQDPNSIDVLEEDTQHIDDYDPLNIYFEDNLDKDLVETKGDTFSELRQFLNFTDLTSVPKPFDSNSLRDINIKSEPLEKDNNKLVQYNKSNVPLVSLPLS